MMFLPGMRSLRPRGKAVAIVIAVVDVVCEIRDVPEDALVVAELMIDPDVEAVLVIGSGSVGEIVILIATADARPIGDRIKVDQRLPDRVRG